jgi:hypothetical protein
LRTSLSARWGRRGEADLQSQRVMMNNKEDMNQRALTPLIT